MHRNRLGQEPHPRADRPSGEPVPDRDADHRPARRVAAARSSARRHHARSRRPDARQDRRSRAQLQHPRARRSTGVIIRRVRLTRPQVVGGEDGRTAAGISARWSSAIARSRNAPGPNRPIEIQSIEVIDGRVSLQQSARLRRRARADRFPVAERAVLVHLRPGALDARRSIASRGSAMRRICRSTRSAARSAADPAAGSSRSSRVKTARSAFTLDGRVNTHEADRRSICSVRAPRFAFQEWSGVLRGLKNIAVEAAFDTSLKGPVNQLETDLRLTGTGGAVHGRLTLDTSVPGWHGDRRGRRRKAEPGALAEPRRAPVRHHRPRHLQPGARARTPLPARHLHVQRPARDVHGLRGATTCTARGQITATDVLDRRGRRRRLRRAA